MHRRAPIRPPFACAFLTAVAFLAQPAAASEHTLYSFSGAPNGNGPGSTLASDAAGNLYGVTVSGGTPNCSGSDYYLGCGTIYELSKRGGAWVEHVIYRFEGGNRGLLPEGGVIIDRAGNLFGTAYFGGPEDAGVVYKLSRANGHVRLSILHTFTGGADDGQGPYGDLLADAAGNLFGTTILGGNPLCKNGCGTVYELSPTPGGGYGERLLELFDLRDGADPSGALVADAKGDLFGTTAAGGANDLGVVFELMPAGKSYALKVIHEFAGIPDGAIPEYVRLAIDSAGDIYGTTSAGGSSNCSFGNRGCGTVFALSERGGFWKERILYAFHGGGDGWNPTAGVTFDGGDLFGVTEDGGNQDCGGTGCGTVFEIVPKADSGEEHVIYRFRDGASGRFPANGVTFDRAGALIGTAYSGGAGAYGTVFQISPR